MLFGAVLGFSTFLISIGSIEGILFRPDEHNKMKFTLVNVGQFLKAPFQVGTEAYKTVWGIVPGVRLWNRLKLLSMNWIVLTGFGAILDYAICFHINNKNNYRLFE
jgi:hypothetical protein